ncbi:unnamed protein product [Schistosoma mattheei]|uniref:Uncharacterized protein n=1 Tax=Schistosoma mattheei TaxID=31246 RepID=A0A183Q737_9TREM|nr:unnamed protein product [Schistosoma mattheei]
MITSAYFEYWQKREFFFNSNHMYDKFPIYQNFWDTEGVY